MMPTMPQIETSQDGRVLTVRLLNPPRNFMTTQMVRELDELLRELESDDETRAVVITGGVDGIFITHFDVAEIVAGAGGPAVSTGQAELGLRAVSALELLPGTDTILSRGLTAGLTGLRRLHETFSRINRLDKVFVAAINGIAFGGGFELALACDIRVLSDDGQIGLPEATVGIIPGGGGTQRLTRALGTSRALEIMLEGRPLDAEEAHAIGLVHHLAPPARVERTAAEIALRLADRPPAAVRSLKRAVYDGATRPLQDGLKLEQAAFLEAATSQDARVAMQTYLDAGQPGLGR
jgi:enoyl-CoA hydratase